jgi:flagellar basal-body rod protein FlgF
MSITAQLLFVAASGARAMERRLESISNNIANVDTPGYKREDVKFSTIYVPLTQKPPSKKGDPIPTGYFPTYNLVLNYAGQIDNVIYLEQGAIRETGNKLDFAIEGKGFFVVENEDGKRFLTRDGSFKVDRNGFLRTSSGYYVLGRTGSRIVIPDPTTLSVSENGRIYSKGNEIDTLLIVKQPVEKRLGSNLWKYRKEFAEPDYESKVYQGFLEDSNVNVVYEIVKMIEAHRTFDADLHVVKAGDELLGFLNDFGRV